MLQASLQAVAQCASIARGRSLQLCMPRAAVAAWWLRRYLPEFKEARVRSGGDFFKVRVGERIRVGSRVSQPRGGSGVCRCVAHRPSRQR